MGSGLVIQGVSKYGARPEEASPPESSVGPASQRPTNHARAIFHFASAAVALTSVALLPTHPGIIIAIAVTFATYAWSMEIARRLFPRLNASLMRMYGPVAHPHEAYEVNSATWYATALVFLALFASREATMASLAVLGVADPVAAMVGRRWGRHMLRRGRSLEGSLGFLVCGIVVAAPALFVASLGSTSSHASLSHIATLAVLAGFTGAVTEVLSTRLDDNLTIPVSVGAILTLATLS